MRFVGGLYQCFMWGLVKWRGRAPPPFLVENPPFFSLAPSALAVTIGALFVVSDAFETSLHTIASICDPFLQRMDQFNALALKYQSVYAANFNFAQRKPLGLLCHVIQLENFVACTSTVIINTEYSHESSLHNTRSVRKEPSLETTLETLRSFVSRAAAS